MCSLHNDGINAHAETPCQTSEPHESLPLTSLWRTGCNKCTICLPDLHICNFLVLFVRLCIQPRHKLLTIMIPKAAKFPVGQGSSDLQTQRSFSAAILGWVGAGVGWTRKAGDARLTT